METFEKRGRGVRSVSMRRLFNPTLSKGRRTMNRPLPLVRFKREIIAGGVFTRPPRFSHVKPNSILDGHVAEFGLFQLASI